MEVLEFIAFFLSASWDFFTEVKVPGFDFSIGALLVGLFLADLGLRFLMMMLGVHFPSGDVVRIADRADRHANKSKTVRGFGQ